MTGQRFARRSPEKWRPSIGLIVFTVLAAVAALPLVGLFFFRVYDNQLIHQTQAELIAQSRVLAAVYAREVEARLGAGIPLGAEIPLEARPDPERLTPIRPALDLAGDGTREFAQLSQSFLDMARQLSQRSDTIATFSAHLTHELKSPLTSIKGAAELLLDSLQSQSDRLTLSEQTTFLSNILADTKRLEAMSQRLRELARAETAPQNERSELTQIVGGLKTLFPTPIIDAGGCLDRAIGMSGEKALIVLSHLADNAIRHNARSLRLIAVADDDAVRMTIANDGDPISEPNREKIFEAFFTTRRDAGGTGMGLAIVRAVMTSHGGSIRLLPSDHGVAFELLFPVA
jgi:two-component system, OmpR family, sensor histidine kinase CreC